MNTSNNVLVYGSSLFRALSINNEGEQQFHQQQPQENNNNNTTTIITEIQINSNNNKNTKIIEEEELQQFHPISCEKCKQIHKKCDKKLPSCSTCLKKGLTCVYTTPKRNPKPKNRNKLISNNNNISNNNEVNHHDIDTAVPSRTSQKSNSTTTVTLAKSLERNQNRFQPYPSVNNNSSSLLLTTNNSSNNGTDTDTDTSLKNFLNRMEEAKNNVSQFSFIKQNVQLTLTSLEKSTQELYQMIIIPNFIYSGLNDHIFSSSSTSSLEGKALLYSLHANIEQRLGSPINRQIDLVESTKSLLGLVSYDRTNTKVILAQYFLSICLLGHGKFKDALFYLNQMNFAVEELKSSTTQLGEYEKALVKINEIARIEISIEIEIDQDDILSVIPFNEFFIKKYSPMYDIMSEYVPPIQTLFPKELHTKEYLFTHLRTIEWVTGLMFIFVKANNKDKLKNPEIDLFEYFYKRFMKLLCIKNIDKFEFGLIINLCKEMMEGTDLKHFELLPSKIIDPIIVSVKEVLRTIRYFQSMIISKVSVNKMEEVNNIFGINLFELLEKHLNVLKRLACKFKRIEIYYSDLMREMEVVLLESDSYFKENYNSGDSSGGDGNNGGKEENNSFLYFVEDSNEELVFDISDESEELLKEFIG